MVAWDSVDDLVSLFIARGLRYINRISNRRWPGLPSALNSGMYRPRTLRSSTGRLYVLRFVVVSLDSRLSAMLLFSL